MSKFFSQLTLVIVSYNSSQKVIRLISKLNKKFKIIIVENSNDKKLEKKILKKNKNIKFFFPHKNNGFGAGLNYGIKKCKSKYVLYLDIDTKISTTQILKLYRKTILTKNFGVITAKIKGQNYKDLIIGKDKKNKMSIVIFNTGCVMMFNKRTFKQLGGFDENFFLYFEETDYYERCMKKNKKIFLYDKITVEHEGRGSINKNLKQKYNILRNWHYCWSKFNYYVKHKGYLTAFSKTFPNLKKSIIGIFVNLLNFNKNKLDLHLAEFKGLLCAYLGIRSYYRIN